MLALALGSASAAEPALLQPLPFVGGAFAVVVDDVDGDGRNDLVVTNRSKETAQILYQKAPRQFEAGPAVKVLGFHANELTRLPGNDHRYVLSAEGEGQLKLLAPDGKGGLREIANRPQDGPFTTTAFSWPNWGTSLAVAPYQGAGWTLLRNFQTDTAKVEKEYVLGAEGHSVPGAVTAADIDGDGVVELLYTTRRSRTLWRVDYPKDDKIPEPVLVWTASVGGPRHVVVADLNGDEALDILVPLESERRIAVLLNNGKGQFAPGPELPVPSQAWGPNRLAIAQTKDGNWFLVTDAEQSLFLYRIERGSPYRHETVELPLDGSVNQILLQDVDGDDEPDLVIVLSKIQNSLQILYGPLWQVAVNQRQADSVANQVTEIRDTNLVRPAPIPPSDAALASNFSRALAQVGDHPITIKDFRDFGLQAGLGQDLQSQSGQIRVLRRMIEEALLRKAVEQENSKPGQLSQEEYAAGLRRLQDQHFPTPPAPDETVLKAYYDTNREEFGIPEMVRLIQIQFRNDRDQPGGLTARQRAERTLRRLEAGEDFSKLAAELTENPRARDTGPDRGFVARNAEPWLQDAVRGLQPGQRTGIVQSPVGYELLLLTDWRAPLIADFQSARAKVTDRWQAEQQQKARDRYLKMQARKIGVVVKEKELEKANPAHVQAGEPLEQRVQRYWAARSANDLPTVYSLESAALPDGWLTPDQYQQVSGLPVREVRIVETKVEGERALVKLEGKVEVGALGWVPQPLADEWVLIDGEWYHQTSKPPAEAKKAP